MCPGTLRHEHQEVEHRETEGLAIARHRRSYRRGRARLITPGRRLARSLLRSGEVKEPKNCRHASAAPLRLRLVRVGN